MKLCWGSSSLQPPWDSAAGRRMEAVFMDDLRHSLEINLEIFRGRPWYRRLAEWTASLITPLL